MARVEALCIGEKKGERKSAVSSALFMADHGIVGDAHAGKWHRQVSILAAEDIDSVRKRGLPQIGPGAFAENVVLSGLDLSSFGLGAKLRLGSEVVVTVTQIGKLCHAPCQIQELTGDCIMPRKGLFARVEVGGEVRLDDPVEVLDLVPRSRIQAVVITVSDRSSRGERADTAGPAVAERLKRGLDARIHEREIVPDDRSVVSSRLRHYCDGHSIDLVVTVGGTGPAPRDVTPEATRDVVERLLPGLDEAMRAASLLKTAHAMLSRGVSGIRGSTLILNLPGSERAAVENIDVVLPALKHAVEKLRGDPSECGQPLPPRSHDA